jgi:fumarate reductase subunit D
MKRLLLYLAGFGLSLLSAWGALLLAFVNPANWKNYRDYGQWDYILLVASNVAIVILLIFVLFFIWRTIIRLSRAMRTSTI